MSHTDLLQINQTPEEVHMTTFRAEPTVQPSWDLAIDAMNRVDGWGDIEDAECDGEDEDGNHHWSTYEITYDWNGPDSEGGLYVVLKPIVENGDLVRYELVSSENL